MSAKPLRTLGNSKLGKVGVLVVGALATQGALAQVDWTDWTSTTSNTVTGTLMVGSTPVGVTYSGVQYSFAQVSGAGTNYWSPTTPYISATVPNAPPGTDIVALNDAGTSTITFSAPVVNPLIALVSWNGAHVTFGGGSDPQTYNIQYLSFGCGFWGCGSYGTPTANSFVGVGELHGVIELLGTYQTFTFTDSTPENWHGLTIGVEGGIATTVPEPGTYALMLTGLGIVGWGVRRRKS
jgi:hypothetical protein